MKVVFVGGGAHRLFPVIRGAMAVPGLLADGEINLYDLNVARAETMGRFLQRSPEAMASGCKITWSTNLDEALDGADAVGVVLMAGSQLTHELSCVESLCQGFIPSDNVSAAGAFLAMKGVPILLDIAQRMERLCPQAWLLDFANPVAVLSSAVNQHTRIKALGVCAGFINHQWDLTRILGKDEACADYIVDVAGINHLSFITRGSLHGDDLFTLLDQRITPQWSMPKWGAFYGSAAERANSRNSVRRSVECYRKYRTIIFSTEGDGLMHLRYDDEYRELMRTPPPSRANVRANVKRAQQARRDADAVFHNLATGELPKKFWTTPYPYNVYGLHEEDIFVKTLTGIGGIEDVRIVTSRPNEGAIDGILNRTVVEYSQILSKQQIRPTGPLAIPPVMHGFCSAVATHQTLLADAIATEDPRLLAQALLAFPVQPYTRKASTLYKALLAINADELPSTLLAAKDYL